jgi:hypothetical protein
MCEQRKETHARQWKMHRRPEVRFVELAQIPRKPRTYEPEKDQPATRQSDNFAYVLLPTGVRHYASEFRKIYMHQNETHVHQTEDDPTRGHVAVKMDGVERVVHNVEIEILHKV